MGCAVVQRINDVLIECIVLFIRVNHQETSILLANPVSTYVDTKLIKSNCVSKH